MKIAFRTDVSNQIGTGHFMRCLTLADQLKKQGAQIHFICRDLPKYLSEMLNAKDMEYISKKWLLCQHITRRCGVFRTQGQWMQLTILGVGEVHLSDVKLLRRSC
jgi:UDP-2,4-diacetamido-2,4,6-trideoxy-beta-L-altropyranose hydrolase